MGCGGSKGATPRKGEFVDEIEFEEVGVADIDDFFTSAKAPLDQVSNLNNNLKGSLLKIQHCNAIIKGGPLVMLQASGDFSVQKFSDGAEEPADVAEAEYGSLNQGAQDALKALKVASDDVKAKAGAASGAEVVVERDFLKVKGKAGDAKAQNALKVAVAEFNFHVNAVRTAGDEVNVVETLKSMKDSIKTAAGGFSVTMEDGVPAISADGLNEDSLPYKPKVFYTTLKTLFESVKDATTNLPSLGDQITELSTKAQELPDKAKDALPKNLEGIKGLKKVATNVKAVSAAPEMVSTLKKTLEETAELVKALAA